MAITTLAQPDGYSGASHQGLNEHGSYHRMIYEDRSTPHTTTSSLDLIKNIQKNFHGSQRSRLVMRLILKMSENEIPWYHHQIKGIGGNLSYYRDQTPGNLSPFYYVTYSENKQERAIDNSIVHDLIAINQAYIDSTMRKIGDGDDFRLDQLEQFQNKGFSIVESMTSIELNQLWQPFGWSESACQEVITNNDGNFVIGVRDRNNRLIASILYSHQPHKLSDGTIINHGELTEATTLPEYRGNGVMGVLATALHVRAIEKDVFNIYGEYRSIGSDNSNPIQSLKFALESGVTFLPCDPLINHVDIDDIPDPCNARILIPGYGSGANQLKNFMLGSLDPKKITPPLQSVYQNAFNR